MGLRCKADGQEKVYLGCDGPALTPNLQIRKSATFLLYIMAEEKGPAKTSIDILPGDVETQGFDESATKKLLRKLDWHIIPFMSLIYLCVFQ